MNGDEHVERASEPGTDPGAAAASQRAGGSIAVRVAGSTAVGLVREHNEDNFAVAGLGTGEIKPRDEVWEDEVDEHGMLFAVCDGMGGAAAGEVASKMAVDILVEAMRRGGVPADRDALARRLVRAVEETGKRIYDAAQKERSRRGMGTTATVAVLADKVLFIAEVGDSRAYLLRRGEIKQLTKDQSLVNQLIEAGHLTEDEAEAFEHSNIILQALGTSENVQVDLTFVELRKGDRLMMCSDGLSGLVHVDTLRQALNDFSDPAECAAKLVSYAEQGGGHDNITVIVADFDGDELQAPTNNDTFGYLQYPLPLEEGQSSAFVDEDTTATSRSRPAAARNADGFDGDEEHYESHFPMAASGEGDTKANALWLLGGVLALAIAAVVWMTIEPAATPSGEQAQSAAPPPPSPAEPEPVKVNIHTDVDSATLMVNGEAKGELSAEQSLNLSLRPGAYRFEAHSDGIQVAVAVVTVRGDMPMDVFLQLPTGQGDATDEPPQVEGAAQGAAAASQGELEPELKPAAGDTPPSAEASAGEEGEASARREERARRRRAERRAQATAEAAQEATGGEPAGPAPAPSGDPSQPTAAQRPAPSAPMPEGIPDNPF